MFACILQAVDSRNAQKSIMLFKQNRISTKKSSFRFYPRVIWKQIFKVIFIIMECFCQYNKTFHIVFKKKPLEIFCSPFKIQIEVFRSVRGWGKDRFKKDSSYHQFSTVFTKVALKIKVLRNFAVSKNGLNDYRVYRIFQSWKRAIRKLTFEKSTRWEEHFLSSCK